MAILVTGGAGFIGAHTCVQLLSADYDVVIADSLVNSKAEMVGQLEKAAGKKVVFYPYDLKDASLAEEIFTKEKIEAVIHFAALKSVGESVEKPLDYYENNLYSAINVLRAMERRNIRTFVFSSSACVYGDSEALPFREDQSQPAVNPYGATKSMIERMLEDLSVSDHRWRISILRYFNPIGAHESGLIGEDPFCGSANLMPHILKAALGHTEGVSVYGNDYNTKDGTGVRDYIHVVDLAEGHLSALKYLQHNQGLSIHNLGTGQGYSVLELIRTFEKTNGVRVPFSICGRRSGDVAASYADPTKAERELLWKAQKNLEDMCRDAWHYVKEYEKSIADRK